MDIHRIIRALNDFIADVITYFELPWNESVNIISNPLLVESMKVKVVSKRTVNDHVVVAGKRTIPNSEMVKLIPQELQRKSVTVSRRKIPYWQENGWERDGDHYWGCYKTPYGKWAGTVVRTHKKHFKYYIQDPPPELKEHSHWVCFSCKGDDLYHIHFSKKPKDVSSGILAIESIISESFE
jgi:hypothetical protein